MPYYERHLPHWQPEDAWLFETWRLAGSLPSHVIPTPAAASPGDAFVAMDRILDQGASGPVWLKDTRVARMLCDVIRQAESPQKLCTVGGYVVMSNHVHLLVLPLGTSAKMTRWVKGISARSANRILGRTGEPFWQHESFDHWVRDSREYDRILRYIEWNPVRAGLVSSPEQWRWSSASAVEEQEWTS